MLWSFSLALVTKLFSFKFRKNIIKEANLIRIPEITSSAAGKFVQLLYTSVACATADCMVSLHQSFHRLRSPASCVPVAAKARVGPPPGTVSMEAERYIKINHMGGSINGGTPMAGWFIVENPIKMDDLGVTLF